MSSGGFNDYDEIEEWVTDGKAGIKAKVADGDLTNEEAETELAGLEEYADEQEAELAALGIAKPVKESFMDKFLKMFHCGGSKAEAKADFADPEDEEEDDLLED
jgi:hypothetical protein